MTTTLEIRPTGSMTHHPCPLCGADTKEGPPVNIYPVKVASDYYDGAPHLWSVCWTCAKRYAPKLAREAAQAWRRFDRDFSHRVLPSVAHQYPAGLQLGRGLAPGGYDTCYADCPVCSGEYDTCYADLCSGEAT